MMNSQLMHADCLVAMRDIPDDSIDAVITDLPYSVLNKSNPGAAWDVELPLDKLWEQWLRIAKEDAPIILFGSGMFTAKLMMSQPRLWKYNLIWDKGRTTGFLNARKMPLRSHEDIVVFYRKLPVYHPQMVKCAPHERNHSRGRQIHITDNCYGKYGKAEQVITEWKYPRSIIRVDNEHKVGHFYHPTSKPVELLRWLIRTYSDGGDMVLDATMGSGSTCVAAVLEKRRYCGIELNDKFFDIACKRVAGARQQANTIFDNEEMA